MNASLYPVAALALLLGGAACRPKPAALPVEQVRTEVAKIMKIETSQIDVSKPLSAQGADDLDIVETIMALEEAFDVEIPDRALGEDFEKASKTLSIQDLAEIVIKQRKVK